MPVETSTFGAGPEGPSTFGSGPFSLIYSSFVLCCRVVVAGECSLPQHFSASCAGMASQLVATIYSEVVS